ncbi:MAG: hypothetical protein ACR2JF_13350 [Iamia sp.]
MVVIDRRPVLALHPGRGRVRLAVVVPEVAREIDLTVHPSAVLFRLHDAARRGDVQPAEAEGELRPILHEAVDAADAWRPGEATEALSALSGAAFPMLGAAYDRGAAPVPEVPRWAVGPLAATSARGAAEAAFGPRATRPVVRALAAALAGPAPGAPVGLAALGLSLAGAATLEPDRLVRVLRAATETGPDDALTVDQLRACRTVIAAVGSRRGEQVLVDATRPGGTARLREVARLWPDVSARLPTRLPGRLPALADRCRALVVTEPAIPARGRPARRAPTGGQRATTSSVARRPRPTLPPTRPHQGMLAGPPRLDLPLADLVLPTDAGPRRGPRPAPRPRPPGAGGGLHPPPTRSTVRPTTPVPTSARLTPLDGWEVEGIWFSRARTCGDLERWGRMLSTCVGDFGPAAAEGRSELLALYRGTEIRGCLELTPDGTIRQLLGPANRALDPPTLRIVLTALVDRGGLDPDDPGNRPWYSRPG